MQFFFRALSKARKWGRPGRRSTQSGAPAQDASTKDDSLRYTVSVCRDEVALGRFIKRLSVSGAEHIQVEHARDGVVRVRMKRPPGVPNWDAAVARLVDRCRLRSAIASVPGVAPEARPAP